MADTIVTQILDDIVSTLKGVTVSGGYNRNIRTALRTATSFTEMPRLDCVFVSADSETKEELSGRSQCLLTVTLTAFAEDSNDTVAAAHDLGADIHKALYVDPTRSNLAIDTSVISVSYFGIEGNETVSGCTVELQILYRHDYGDPYTLT